MKFHTPREIYFGWESAKNLSKIKKRAVIMTGTNVWKYVQDFIPLNASVYEMKHAHGEPVEEDVIRAFEFLSEEKPEWIVAIGGGSVIDTAKLAWIWYEQPKISWREIYELRIPTLREKARFAAMETTSGTGTGISAAAVVTDKRGIKHGIVSQEIIPDMAIYDPDMVMSMPRNTVIYSGMDALTHAIESYVSKVDNIPADTMSLKAVELIFNHLKSSLDGDLEARELVHYGNMMAAMGFTNSRLGLCHAASHRIGGRYGIEHGKLNAILLPHFIRSTERYTRRYEDIERMLKIEDLAHAIEELNRDFGIPSTLPEIENKINELAHEIYEEPLMKTNPGNMNVKEIEEFLKMVAHVA